MNTGLSRRGKTQFFSVTALKIAPEPVLAWQLNLRNRLITVSENLITCRGAEVLKRSLTSVPIAEAERHNF